MADRTYTYYGPLSAVTLAPDAEYPDGRNVQLARGLQVALPEENEYVRSLVARKYLVPVAEPDAAPAPAAEAKAPTASAPASADQAAEAATATGTATKPATAASSPTASPATMTGTASADTASSATGDSNGR